MTFHLVLLLGALAGEGVQGDVLRVANNAARTVQALAAVLVHRKGLGAQTLLLLAVGENFALLIQGVTYVGVVDVLVFGDLLQEVLEVGFGGRWAHVASESFVVAESPVHLLGGRLDRGVLRKHLSLRFLSQLVSRSAVLAQRAPVRGGRGVVIQLLNSWRRGRSFEKAFSCVGHFSEVATHGPLNDRRIKVRPDALLVGGSVSVGRVKRALSGLEFAFELGLGDLLVVGGESLLKLICAEIFLVQFCRILVPDLWGWHPDWHS